MVIDHVLITIPSMLPMFYNLFGISLIYQQEALIGNLGTRPFDLCSQKRYYLENYITN